MKVLGIIPARGGSKGLPKKNIKVLMGRPLIVYTIEEAQKSKYITNLRVSTEDPEIKKVAKKYGVKIIDRPQELAKDNVSSIKVIEHAVDSLKDNFSYIVLLSPTFPFRTAKQIDKAIKKIIDTKCNTVCSVSPIERCTFKRLDKDNLLPATNINYIDRRQDFPQLYMRNGSIYVIEYQYFIKNKSLISQNEKAIITDKISSIDINDMFDFLVAEMIIKKSLFKRI